ncbi:MAG: peptidoglycan D,D-transpeptidase FtsI family protein [Anaerolineae bacterium]
MSAAPEFIDQQRRIIWLEAILAAVGLILLGRLAYWQLVPHKELAFDPSSSNVIPAVRGSIRDCNGEYLVTSTVEYQVAVSPRLLSDDQRKVLAPKLAVILRMTKEEVAAVLAQTGTEYAVLATGLSAEVGRAMQDLEDVEGLNLDAFSIEPSFTRVYPDDGLAASLLGFVNLEGVSQYGVEEYYDGILSGKDGTWQGVTDTYGEQILVSLRGYEPADDGADLVLTIDRNIQREAERLLSEAMAESKAGGGDIIVLDPTNGAILAMAGMPTYDPGEYWNVETLDQFVNTNTSALYEPGSVFKPLTLAAALEAQIIRPDDSYDDRGEIIVGGRLIQNWDKKAHGVTTMTELLAYSRNVGAAHVAALLGPTRFYEIIRRFGFSEVTGVDLPYESAGIMRVPGNEYWHMSDLGANSFGQGISTTPLQVAAAYGALANDGVLMRPHIVAETRDENGTHVQEPVRVRQVISAGVSREITKMMTDAMEIGMQEAQVAGYRFAGKSGTSSVPERGSYQNTDVIASFVGFGPMPEPRFVILVKFDRPVEGYWGTEIAAPVFQKMAEYLVNYYGIEPTER